mmetsp:Transcript_110951/g.192345  ORF Transcript_110951/g.192345 Transcript_110951/m.192345 type:complete len:109 (-) Transcript_110951:677-1003(-)
MRQGSLWSASLSTPSSALWGCGERFPSFITNGDNPHVVEGSQKIQTTGCTWASAWGIFLDGCASPSGFIYVSEVFCSRVKISTSGHHHGLSPLFKTEKRHPDGSQMGQ